MLRQHRMQLRLVVEKKREEEKEEGKEGEEGEGGGEDRP